jgi:hypothetical protein
MERVYSDGLKAPRYRWHIVNNAIRHSHIVANITHSAGIERCDLGEGESTRQAPKRVEEGGRSHRRKKEMRREKGRYAAFKTREGDVIGASKGTYLRTFGLDCQKRSKRWRQWGRQGYIRLQEILCSPCGESEMSPMKKMVREWGEDCSSSSSVFRYPPLFVLLVVLFLEMEVLRFSRGLPIESSGVSRSSLSSPPYPSPVSK